MGYVISDGVIRREVSMGADGVLRTRATQPGEAAEMAKIAAIRDSSAARRLNWAQALVSIPVIKLAELKRRFPALGSVDTLERTEAWKKWARSAEAAPYRLINRKGKGRVRR